MKNKILIAWSYVSEIILSTLVIILLFCFYDIDDISQFIIISSPKLASYFSGIMLASFIAFFWTFYSKSDTPFSQWLYTKGAFNVYLTAYITTISIYTILSLLLLTSQFTRNELLSAITMWFLILGIVNVYTFISNIAKQLRLNMEFNRLRGKNHSRNHTCQK